MNELEAEYSNGQMVVTQVSPVTINGKPYFKYLLRDFILEEPVVGDHYKVKGQSNAYHGIENDLSRCSPLKNGHGYSDGPVPGSFMVPSKDFTSAAQELILHILTIWIHINLGPNIFWECT